LGQPRGEALSGCCDEAEAAHAAGRDTAGPCGLLA
jgi:hypothetical protein